MYGNILGKGQTQMNTKFTKSERRRIRELAHVAWERQLRSAIETLGQSINEMSDRRLTPFEVNDRIHEFHNGISRELFGLYSDSAPWWSVCRAHLNGVLTDLDLDSITETMRAGIRQFAATFRERNDTETREPNVDNR